MKEHKLLNWLSEEMDLPGESVPGISIVEIAADCRVLIENHCGVKAYCSEQISVKVRFGVIHVFGECLQLSRMTRDQLIIRGKIGKVVFDRGCCP